MALGDLTSGINMLPNDSINQGFRSMTSDLGAIEQAKSVEAQNKIKQFNDLANVSLKGLQANAMDEGVDARDAMTKQLAQWEATDGDRGLTWAHQKQAMAMKDNLESMVTMSQENQTLAKQAVQTALKIKDPKAQAEYLNNYKQIMNGKSIAEINQGLHNLSVPPVQTSLTKVINSFPLASKDRNHFNYNSVVDFYKSKDETDDYYVSPFIDQLINKGIVKTRDEAYKYIATKVQDKTVTMPTAYENAYNTALARRNAKRLDANNPMQVDPKNAYHVSLPGDKFKVGNFDYTDANGETQSLKNIQIVGVTKKPDGSVVAEVVPSSGGVNINNFGSNGDPLVAAKTSMGILGSKGNASPIEIPLSRFANYFKDKPNVFKGISWANDAFQGYTEKVPPKSKKKGFFQKIRDKNSGAVGKVDSNL